MPSSVRARESEPATARLLLFIAASALLWVAAGPVSAQTSGGQGQQLVPLPSLSPLAERVLPAVVNVSAAIDRQDVARAEQDGSSPPSQFDDLFRQFFQGQRGGSGAPDRLPNRPRAGQAVALGSGFVIDPGGSIVTNNHVIGNSTKVTVIFQDGTSRPARVLGRDEQTDVALLKVDAGHPLAALAWGDSDASKVGDWVVAVGNPFGLGGTVTAGIISALGRNIQAGPYDDFLQIDAPINRGNSGGPTFNLKGEVVGINTAIYSPSGGSVGIGFAVPANLAKGIVAQLGAHGQVARGWLGVQVQAVTPEIARGLGLPPDQAHGALVANVTPGSPAARAGLKPGDVITRYNGHPVQSVHDLPRQVADTPAGQRADIGVLRNGKEQQLSTEVAEQPAQSTPASAGAGTGGQAAPRQPAALGLQLAPAADGNGAIVTDVAPDSLAAGLVEPGDVIVAVNQQPVGDAADAAAKLGEALQKKQALLLVNHRGTARFVALPVDQQQG
jgi:serine protease Do